MMIRKENFKYYFFIFLKSKMHAVRIELTKQNAQVLKTCPFDRSGTHAFYFYKIYPYGDLNPKPRR
jgi:hypothetical protein